MMITGADAAGLLPQLLLAGLTIAGTALIHAVLVTLVRPFTAPPIGRRGFIYEGLRTIKLVAVALWMIAAHTLSAGLWALAFLRTGVSESFEAALYFALSTYTTLGFGDVLAPEGWRLLTGFAALNGLLLFGLSAAVLVDAAVHLGQPRRRSAS